MNWDAIGAIGQAVSALALIIVIVQVRHARSEVRRSVNQGRSDASRELSMQIAGNEFLARSIFKAHLALGGPLHAVNKPLLDAGLTNDEIGAAIHHQMAYWAYRQSTVTQIHELTAGQRAEFDIGIRYQYGSGFGRLWYSTTKATLNPDAVRYVDCLLAQPS